MEFLLKKNGKIDIFSVSLFFYFFLMFLPDVSRYKSLVLVVFLLLFVKKIIDIKFIFLKSYDFYVSICLMSLLIPIFYGIAISPWPMVSYKDISTSIVLDTIAIYIILPVLFFKNNVEKNLRVVFFGIVLGLVALLCIDAKHYLNDYLDGMSLINDFMHRHWADALLLTSPFLTIFLNSTKKRNLLLGVLLTSFSLFALIGTMARAAWLGALITGLIWVLFNKKIKLMLVFVSISLLVFLVVREFFPQSVLSEKLVQTDSNYRYGNGTQGSAFDLIMKNPVVGYGFGGNVYHRIYNSQVKNHPNWFFKESIGPHNSFLAFWFASGLIGLFGFFLCTILFIFISIKLYFLESDKFIKDFIFSLGMAFFGCVVVRGMFEVGLLNYFGWMLSLLTVISVYLNRKNNILK